MRQGAEMYYPLQNYPRMQQDFRPHFLRSAALIGRHSGVTSRCFMCTSVQMQQDGEIKRVPGLSDFKLPSTFYMTQYRRQAADAMR
eukprot:255675-Pelagomonas_calceolata.AAC.12